MTRYTYADGPTEYAITYTRHSDLLKQRFIELLHGPARVAAELAHFDGSYQRFAGELRIEHRENGKIVDQFADDAIWELMYFGHPRP